MKKQKMFGVIFLSVGILWLAVIFGRCEAGLWGEQEKGGISFQQIQQQLEMRILSAERSGKSFSLRKHLPKMFIMEFWAIACWEFVCALLFLVSGFALLRKHIFARQAVLFALTADIVLKGLIVTYQHYVLEPLAAIFDGKNVLVMYFVPGSGWGARVSAFLSGARLVQTVPGRYAFIYTVMMAGLIYIFTKEGKGGALRKS